MVTHTQPAAFCQCYRMSFIEVFDPKERSFYRAELLDIKGDFAKIAFEGTERRCDH